MSSGLRPALRIVRAGPACTLQDEGRRGFLRFGVTTAGPMDWLSHARARLFAGMAAAGVAIEIGPGGLDVEADGDSLRLGICADGFAVKLAGDVLDARCAVTLKPGERLAITPGPTNVWAYLAWAGDASVAPVMGSLSTHVRSGVGPLGGAALATGTLIPVLPHAGTVEQTTLEWPLEGQAPGGTVRFVPGPQADYFSPEAFAAFCASPYKVTNRSDRMGYRLDGPQVAHARGHDIVSDGIAMGAIQIPGDGLPIVLMADRQPTGGYPKIGTVIRADLPKLAQARAGSEIRFQPVSIAEAVAALKTAVPTVAQVTATGRPRGGLDLERLRSGDYASGIVNALTPPGN